MNETWLRIADFSIKINWKPSANFGIKEGYTSFLCDAPSTEYDLLINAHLGITESQKDPQNVIYSATLNGGYLWTISERENNLWFRVYNPENPEQLQQLAKLNSDRSTWNIYCNQNKDGEQTVFPLAYPMGPLIMYYLTLKFDAIMIHGSGISDNGLGQVFTGVSGQGKTTMAKLWFDGGADVLNDDRLIIRKSADGYTVYNTPMFYEDEPRYAKLKSIHSIYHSPENRLERLDGSSALNAVMPNVIQHGYSPALISHHLDFVSKLIQSIPVYRLGFYPNNKVVEKLRTNELCPT